MRIRIQLTDTREGLLESMLSSLVYKSTPKIPIRSFGSHHGALVKHFPSITTLWSPPEGLPKSPTEVNQVATLH